MLAIKSEEGDLIFLDVVSQYSRGFQSQTTEHPVDGSGTISDHVINRNPTITIQGYITAADFNSTKPQELIDADKDTLGVESIVVEGSVATVAEINYESNASNLFPDVIGQFFTESRPEITNILAARGNEKDIFKILKNYRDTKANLILYEFDFVDGRDQIVETIPENPSQAVFITSLSIDETPSNGDALLLNLSLSVVTIASLREEELPEDSRVPEKTAERSNKGVQSGDEAAVEDIQGSTDKGTGAYRTYVLGQEE